MHLLITSATLQEIEIVQSFLKNNFVKNAEHHFVKKNLDVELLVTGVSAIATTYSLSNRLQNNLPDLIIQTGIAGAFNHQLKIGEVVAVENEFWGDLGAEDQEDFLDIFDLGLADKDQFPYQNKALINNYKFDGFNSLKKVKGLTVNCSSGSRETIDKRIKIYGCDIESMEGAALHFVGMNKNIPYVQIRAVSNYVTPRNKKDWDIPLAVNNVNIYIIDFLTGILYSND